MGNWILHPPISLTGGLKTVGPDDLVAPGQGVVYQNIDTSDQTFKKRGGLTRINTTAIPKSALKINQFSPLLISHDPIGDKASTGDLSLGNFYTIELVFKLEADVNPYGRDSLGLSQFVLLQKSGYKDDQTFINHLNLFITDSNNGSAAEDQPPGAQASEGIYKVWFWQTINGNAVYVSPSDAGGSTYVEIVPGETYHVLVTRFEEAASNEKIQIYINGSISGSTLLTGTERTNAPDDNGFPLHVGWNNHIEGWHDKTGASSKVRSDIPFVGKINELRIRNAKGIYGLDASPSNYYDEYGDRLIRSGDGTDVNVQDETGGSDLNIYGSLTFYSQMNDGSGLPSITKSDSGRAADYRLKSGIKSCSWDDAFDASDSCVRFDVNDMIIVPNAYLYRTSVEEATPTLDVQELDKATYRLRFQTPASFMEDSGAGADDPNPHSTLLYIAGTVADLGGGSYWGGQKNRAPNTVADTGTQYLQVWLRLLRHDGVGALRLWWGDESNGRAFGLTSTALVEDTEYCVFITKDFSSFPATIKMIVVTDPDGTPTVETLSNTVATDAKSTPNESEGNLRYVFTIGDAPDWTDIKAPALTKDEVVAADGFTVPDVESVSKTDPNGIVLENRYLESARYPFYVDEVSVFSDIVVNNDDQAKALGIPLPATRLSAFGRILLSHWNFNAGSGDFVEDQGSLGNHLTTEAVFDDLTAGFAATFIGGVKSSIKYQWPYRPSFKATDDVLYGEALVTYDGGSPIKFIAEYRRENADSLILVGVPGAIYKLTSSDTFELIKEGFEGSSDHWKAFVYLDFMFIMIPGAPMLKFVGERGFSAGLEAPIYSTDSAFTFVDHAQNATAQVFGHRRINHFEADHPTDEGLVAGSTYKFVLTYFSATTSVESAPGPICTITTQGTSGDATRTIVLAPGDLSTNVNYNYRYLPVPRDEQVTHYRIYRTVANGGTFFYEDQFPIGSDVLYLQRADGELGENLDSFFNNKPPQEIKDGVLYKGRAFYTDGQRVFLSRIGFPEYVPTTYLLDIADDRGSGVSIRGLKSYRDRVIGWTDQGSSLFVDQGFDISLDSPQDPPVSQTPMQADDGLAGRSAITEVTGVGVIVAGQKGLYATTGEAPQYFSENIEPTYQALDLTEADGWQMIHWLKKNMILLGIPDSSADATNQIIVWDYSLPQRPFGIWTVPKFSTLQKIRDNAGSEEVWVGDDSGFVSRFDQDEDWDGLPLATWNAGTTPVDQPLTGTLSVDGIEDATTSTFQLDYKSTGLPGGDRTGKGVGFLITLIAGSNSAAALGTVSTRLCTYWNTSDITPPLYTYPVVSPKFDFLPKAGDTYIIGGIDLKYESGNLILGDSFRIKKNHHINFEQVVQSTLTGTYNFLYKWIEDSGYQTLTVDNTSLRVSPGPLLGSGSKFKFKIEDNNAVRGVEIQYLGIGYFRKARRPYVVPT